MKVILGKFISIKILYEHINVIFYQSQVPVWQKKEMTNFISYKLAKNGIFWQVFTILAI